jgi:hypothetical protein
VSLGPIAPVFIRLVLLHQFWRGAGGRGGACSPGFQSSHLFCSREGGPHLFCFCLYTSRNLTLFPVAYPTPTTTHAFYHQLAQMLRSNTVLESLSLAMNNVGSTAARDFASVVTNRTGMGEGERGCQLKVPNCL